MAKYNGFHKWLKDENLVNSKRSLIGFKEARKRGKLKVWEVACKRLRDLTRDLPVDDSIAIRMRYIRLNITPKENECPICKNGILRSWSVRSCSFNSTCSLRDNIHKEYIKTLRVKGIIYEKIWKSLSITYRSGYKG